MLRLWTVGSVLAFVLPAFGTIHYTYSVAKPAAPESVSESTVCSAGSSEYSMYVGAEGDVALQSIWTERDGSVVVAGTRQKASGQASYIGQPFVARIDGEGCLAFTVTIATPGSAIVPTVLVTRAGEIVVAGWTQGSEFPLRNALRREKGAGFLIRLRSDGAELLSSSFIDGAVNALTADEDSNLYLSGTTYSATFPNQLQGESTRPREGTSAVYAAYYLKLNRNASQVLASGYLTGADKPCAGGSGCTLSERGATAQAIGIDAERNIYLGGNAFVSDFPKTSGSFRPAGLGPFVAKISSDGRKLLYTTGISSATYGLAPAISPASTLRGMQVSLDGRVLVVGGTADAMFPTTPGALQVNYSGPGDLNNYRQTDAFVLQLNPSGTAVMWSTLLGESNRDEAFHSVSRDSDGNIWLVGSTGLPFAGQEGLVVGLSPDVGVLRYRGVYGGGWGEVGVIDSAGVIRLAGGAGYVSAQRFGGAARPRILALSSGTTFQVRGDVSPGQIVSLYGNRIGPQTPATFQPDSDSRVPVQLGGVQVLFGTTPAPLLYVSENQINAIVPKGLHPGARVEVRTRVNGSMPLSVYVATTAPAIFAVVNADGTLNSAITPAAAGSFVSVYLTGVGTDERPDGTIATEARGSGCCRVYANGSELEVLYAGDAPGFVTALSQINVRTPDTSTIEVVTGDGRRVPAFVYVAR